MSRSTWRAAAAALAVFLAAAPLSAGEASRDTGKLLLWRARSETAVVYLLGTIHFSSKDMYPLDAAIEKAFEESDVLVMELSISMPRQIRAAALAVQEGLYPAGETLAANISPETRAKLDAYVAERGLSPAQFEKMRPWLVSLTLVALEYVRLGFDPSLGIDKHFHNKALKRKIPIWELETVEYQLKIFSDGTPEEHELELAETLEQLPKAGAFLDRMIAAWAGGDASALDREMRENMTTNEKLKPREQRLLYDRNIHMTDKIEKLFGLNGTYLVMVGSGHFVGDKSIIRLLEEKGRKVEQLDKAPAAQPAPTAAE